MTAIITAKATNSGIMATLEYLAIRTADPELEAEASSLVTKKKIRAAIARPLKTAVKPIAAMVLTVVTVLTVTVVIINKLSFENSIKR